MYYIQHILIVMISLIFLIGWVAFVNHSIFNPCSKL